MGALLTCAECGVSTETALVEFDDMPIEQWWASKGQRCTPCRTRTTRRPHPPAAVVRVTVPSTIQRLLPAPGTKRREVFDALFAVGDRGATTSELVAAFPLHRDVRVELQRLTDAGFIACQDGTWRATTKRGIHA